MAGSLKRKVDHDIRCGKAGTTEKFSFRGRPDEIVFQEIEVRLQLWVYKGVVDFGGNATSDGLEEEGNGSVLDTYMVSIKQRGRDVCSTETYYH